MPTSSQGCGPAKGSQQVKGRSVVDFGYFTLGDNHYENNTRAANQFVTDIAEEALHADKLGMHSAWIGEHHFNSLGVLSCPDLVLAYIAARTKRIRLAPAVTVLPLHHPIRVASNGPRSICSATGAWILRPDAATTGGSTCPSTSRSRTIRASSTKGSKSCANCGPRRTASLTTASTIPSTTCVLRRSRCSGRSRPMSDRFPNPRSNWRRGSIAA